MLLGGRLKYRQFQDGHRSGFEPVLLAASVAASPGALVLEAGTGAGAAILCLSARVQGIRAIGVEIDPALARLAAENFQANGLQAAQAVVADARPLQAVVADARHLHAVVADARHLHAVVADARHLHAIVADARHLPFGPVFDHAMANPPWHEAAGTLSPDALRALAHHAPPELLIGWIGALAGVLKPGGWVHLILPAALADRAEGALGGSGCGAVRVRPLYPRAGRQRKQVIIAAQAGGMGERRELPGLVLHDAAGITAAAEAILRGGEGFGG
jgi:tRNA1(Val) A37 N6-methylase TrmN6